jgi:hypothetical protein
MPGGHSADVVHEGQHRVAQGRGAASLGSAFMIDVVSRVAASKLTDQLRDGVLMPVSA